VTATVDTAAPGETIPARPTPRRRTWIRPAAAAGAGLLAAAWPALAGTYWVIIAATALVFVILAWSTQLVTGVAGLPTIGQPAYLGVGAYTAALLGTGGHPFALGQLAAATAAAALAGAVSAPLMLRTRGTAHLMATVALQSLAATAASQWATVTGGSEGLHVPPVTLWPGGPPLTGPAYLYWYALTVTIVIAVAVGLLMRSRLVLLLRGIAGHEPRMAALGHPVTGELTLGYVIAAAMAGAAGALLVAVNQYVAPADLGFDTAALVLLAAAIGAGTMTGAAIGAVLIVAVRDGFGVTSGGMSPLLLGLLFLAVAYRKPAQSALSRWYRRRSRP
jgi:branched-chain amino acid transport system permease protein